MMNWSVQEISSDTIAMPNLLNKREKKSVMDDSEKQ